MPNEVSDTIHNIEHAIVSWAEGEAIAFKGAIKREWILVEPDILSLSKTIASQVMVAALAYFSGGATMSQAVASVTSQLPAELKSIEHIIVVTFGLAVADLQAKQAVGQPVQ
jgi:hypothetical protein